MDCDIFLVGLNHRTAGVDVRERFALVNHCDEEHWALPCIGAVSEAMILSTCNRVELLAAGAGDVSGQMLDCWAKAREADAANLRPIFTFTKTWKPCATFFPWPPVWTPWSWASRRYWGS